MDRKIYITNGIVSLAEYIDALDDLDNYNCWQDPQTQKGYNYRETRTIEAFRSGVVRSRFIATILKCADHVCIGSIFVSPVDSPPDLAIKLYQPFRNQGYGTMAFSLGIRYCFEFLKLDEVYAGCYEDNVASMKMIPKCGLQPHPEGNQIDKHYLTGEDRLQYDFVIRRTGEEINR